MQQLQLYNELCRENDCIYRDLARTLNLPECAMWILYCLRVQNAPMTASQLCDMMLQPKQTIHSALKKLETDGLLEPADGPDRRRRPMRLTEKGLLIAHQTADQVIRAERQAFAALSEQDQALFLQLFRRYTDALSNAAQTIRKENDHANPAI